MLRLLGAELELTPAEKGIKGSIDRAQELIAELPDAVIPQQFENTANPEIHSRTTAEEIWRDTDGKVDAMVSGVGPCVTLPGGAQILKPRNPDFSLLAVEPDCSPVLEGGGPEPQQHQ